MSLAFRPKQASQNLGLRESLYFSWCPAVLIYSLIFHWTCKLLNQHQQTPECQLCWCWDCHRLSAHSRCHPLPVLTPRQGKGVPLLTHFLKHIFHKTIGEIQRVGGKVKSLLHICSILLGENAIFVSHIVIYWVSLGFTNCWGWLVESCVWPTFSNFSCFSYLFSSPSLLLTHIFLHILLLLLLLLLLLPLLLLLFLLLVPASPTTPGGGNATLPR